MYFLNGSVLYLILTKKFVPKLKVCNSSIQMVCQKLCSIQEYWVSHIGGCTSFSSLNMRRPFPKYNKNCLDLWRTACDRSSKKWQNGRGSADAGMLPIIVDTKSAVSHWMRCVKIWDGSVRNGCSSTSICALGLEVSRNCDVRLLINLPPILPTQTPRKHNHYICFNCH